MRQPACGSRPRISVIMNCYNGERYLMDALDSVLAQTFTDWELVFWDDHSTDRSADIVHSYDEPRFRYFHAECPNTLAESRNLAVQRARGDWLAFLDTDDVWLPHKLEVQIAAAAERGNENTGIIYARTIAFSSRGDQGDVAFRYAGRNLPEGDIYRTLLLEGSLIPVVSAMVRTSAYHAIGGIPREFTFAEDYYLFVAVAKRYNVLCVQAACCKYRMHDDTMTHGNKDVSHREGLKILDLFRDGLTPAELRRRKAVYHTLIAVDMVSKGDLRGGIGEVLRHGSLPYLLRGVCSNFYRRVIKRQRLVS